MAIHIGSFVVALLAGLAFVYIAKAIFLPAEKKKAPLPPGPKPLPLLGNIADLPPAGVREWEHWGKHKDLYGMFSTSPRIALDQKG